jgi:hypothetical protein
MAKRRIGLTTNAEKHLDTLVASFRRNLRDVASSIAEHAQLEAGHPKHVDDAFNVLKTSGLTATIWYQRPELKVGLGGLFFGGSGAAGDIFAGLADYFPVLSWLKQFSGLAVAVCIVVGSIFMIWGWVSRQNVPSGRPCSALARITCWPWAACEHRGVREGRPDDACHAETREPIAEASNPVDA